MGVVPGERDSGQCTVFGKAYLKSRSSDAFTSEIKDFIAPIPVDITNCAPVTLNNKAWAEADNFKPTGGNVGDPISDTGKIEVAEDTSASLNVDRTSVRLARARVNTEATTGVTVALDAPEPSGRRESPERAAAADGQPAAIPPSAGRLEAVARPAPTAPLPRPGPDPITTVVT